MKDTRIDCSVFELMNYLFLLLFPSLVKPSIGSYVKRHCNIINCNTVNKSLGFRVRC